MEEKVLIDKGVIEGVKISHPQYVRRVQDLRSCDQYSNC